MDSGWKCTVCGHVSPDGFGSCEGCMEKEIQHLTKENERLREENKVLLKGIEDVMGRYTDYDDSSEDCCRMMYDIAGLAMSKVFGVVYHD